MERFDVTDNIARGPARSDATRFKQLLDGRARSKELPPWLIIRDRVVMRYGGKHHVCRTGGRDPFDVACDLHQHLIKKASRP